MLSAARRTAQRGSIFVEVLLTISILGIASVLLMTAILYGVYLGHRAERQSIATELANEQLEMIRNLPAASLPIQQDGPLLGNPPPDVTVLPEGTATLTIQPDPGDSDLYTVELTLAYREGTVTRTLTFATLVANGGLNE